MNIPDMPDLNIPLPEANNIFDVAGTIAEGGFWLTLIGGTLAVGYLLWIGLTWVVQKIISRLMNN